MKEILEPNKELLLKSYISAIQTAYTGYKKALNEYMRYTGYDNDGDFFMLNGAEIRAKRLDGLLEDIKSLKIKIDALKLEI